MNFILSLLLALLLVACNDTSDSSNDAMSNNFTVIRGTVPGTLIEAYCDDGSYFYAKSVHNNSTKHPFSLKVPRNLRCRLIMITNEENIDKKIVTHINLVTANVSHTVFKSVEPTAQLGYIDLALERNNIADSNGDGVADEVFDVSYDGTSLQVSTTQEDIFDDDGDGIINIYEDDDNDGQSNKDDDDDDGDGIKDIDDHDYDNDRDYDGINDRHDVDDDNDGIYDEYDIADDNKTTYTHN